MSTVCRLYADCLPTIFRLLHNITTYYNIFCYLSTIRRLYVYYMSNCLSTVCRLYVDCLSTICRLFVDCLSTICRLFVDYMSTVCRLYVDYMSTVCRLYVDYLSTICRLYVDYMSTLCRLYVDYMSTLCRLYVDFMSTLCRLYVDFMSTICLLYVYYMSISACINLECRQIFIITHIAMSTTTRKRKVIAIVPPTHSEECKRDWIRKKNLWSWCVSVFYLLYRTMMMMISAVYIRIKLNNAGEYT